MKWFRKNSKNRKKAKHPVLIVSKHLESKIKRENKKLRAIASIFNFFLGKSLYKENNIIALKLIIAMNRRSFLLFLLEFQYGKFFFS